MIHMLAVHRPQHHPFPAHLPVVAVSLTTPQTAAQHAHLQFHPLSWARTSILSSPVAWLDPRLPQAHSHLPSP
jgi:hypothetical protein